jgi:hypothetical protein
MDPLAGRYDTAMDKDIYDVFRGIVNSLRGSVIDTEIAEWLAIIDKHAEAAAASAPAGPAPAPEPAAPAPAWSPLKATANA